MKKMSLIKALKNIMKRKNKKVKKQKRANPAGTKLSKRLLKNQIREINRSEKIYRNAGKATQPGTLQGGRPLPWSKKRIFA
jgi:hypothetical protein